MQGRWRLATLVAVVGCVAAPTAADAATRYAEPGGDGPEPCLQADPCGIRHATEGHVASDVVSGDEIIALPGEYSVTQPVSLLDPNLRLHGQAGQPRPQIVSTSATALFTNQTGIEISHLEVKQSGSNSGLVTSPSSSATIEDVRVHTFNPTAFSFTCQLTGTVIMRNSVCWSSGAAGAAVGINISGGAAAVTLRNVTAISSSSVNSYGIYYSGDGGATLSATATNVIANGLTADVASFASGGATSAVTLDHSNYNSQFEVGGTVTDPGSGTNQTAAPAYLDDATGGFHQAAGSPTINQGVNDAANGSFDIDLEPRTLDTTTDIGADEFASSDADGDGRPDGADDCPTGDTGWTSNASTDHDLDGCRDAGEDTDDDNDSKADGGDDCPTGSIGWTSTSITDVDGDGCRDLNEDNDDDDDTVADGSDNCPVNANPAQADYDSDGPGDACDSDDDNDSKSDGSDACATGDLGWTSTPATDVDSDGCRDAGEDADDDDDTVNDGADNCPVNANTDQANNDGDSEGDVCDADDDDDTVDDGADNCPVNANTDQADADADGLGDACDPVNDDIDGDGVLNADDNCPDVANAGQQDSDGDDIGDACDPSDGTDTDGDGIPDVDDDCPETAGPVSNGGCPVTPDDDPPETTITKGPKKKTEKSKAKLKFRSDEAGSTFECRLDKGEFEPCESPLKVKRLDRGKHRVQVRATDPAGNVDASPAKWKWKVLG